jgi:hypothetical protein
MNTFFLIIKNYFKITDDVIQNMDTLQKIIYFMFIQNKKEYSIEIKFKYFIDEINNIFYSEKQKEDFINIFCKIQKTYFALSRFAYLYKYKKAKIVVDFDLCLNPIDVHNKNTICLLQENYKYYFRLNDLINIITSALSNTSMFFSEPLISKNPYNNVPFNKSTLYNIYFNIRAKTYIIPELFHKFFLSNFNINNFEEDYEYLIRENAIRKYVKNNDDEEGLYSSVFTMIGLFNDNNSKNYNNPIKISHTFPKKKLVDIMRPYLMLYYLYQFSFTAKKNCLKNILLKKLNKFFTFNPAFGRPLIEVQHYFSKNNKKIYKNIYTYNDKHINFYEDDSTELFLTSHLLDK